MIPKRIAAFGSSSVYGSYDSEMGGFINRFRLMHESKNPAHRVYNLGVWGESITALTARIANEALARQPHLILIYPGFNDLRRQGSCAAAPAMTIEEFANSIDNLISAATNVAPVLMMSGYPFDQNRTQPLQGTDLYYNIPDASHYSDVLREVCVKSKVKLLDYFSLYKNKDLTTFWSNDGLHFNAAGHQLLAETLHDYLYK